MTAPDQVAQDDSRARLIRQLADGQVHSGEALGAALGMSRAGVWKVIRRLAALGVGVSQQAGRGYWLSDPLQLTDNSRIEALLNNLGSPPVTLAVYLSCESTNSSLIGKELPAAPGFSAVIADHQSGGRGRLGRSWRSALGQGIYLSLGQRQPGGLARVAAMSLVAGVACCRALADLGVAGVGLKWPNDLWFEDRKLGGLLVEADGEVGGDCQWVAGVGINWHLSGSVDLSQPWIDLHEITGGAPPDRNSLCARVLHQLMRAADELAARGPAPQLAAWRELDVLRGRPVRVLQNQEELAGVCAGIDDSGALLLEQSGKRLTIASGDVSLRLA